MKRAYPQKLKPFEASEIERDGVAEPSKQQTIESLVTASSGRVRSLATLGLAISVGASGILLPRSGDSARATEPAPAAEPAVEIQSVSTANTALNSELVDAAAEPLAANTLLPVGEQPSMPTAAGMGLQQQTASVAAPMPESIPPDPIPTEAIDPNQELNLTGSQASVSSPIAPEIESTQWSNNSGAIDSLKKQENRTTAVRPAELGFEEPASSSKSAVPVEISGQNPAPTATATKTTIPDLSTTPAITSDRINLRDAGVKPEETAAQPFESIEQSLPTPSLPAAAVVPPVQKATENAIAAAQVIYSVRPGDTLSAIAKGHGVSPQELIAINKLGDPNFLNVNQRLKIPQKIGSNNSAVRAAASTSASNSTSAPSAVATPGVLLPNSPAPEIANPSKTPIAPAVPLVSPLANIEGVNNISAPMVPQINSIPLTQVSQSMSDSGKLELQGEPTFTGAVDTSSLPVSSATASTSVARAYPQPTNLASVSGRSPAAQLPLDQPSQALPTSALNPYAERLRAEVARLREEYRAERNSIGTNSVSLAAVDKASMPVATGNPSENIQNLNPDFRASEYAQAVQDEVARPASRAWSEQVQRQQQERFDPMRAAELQPINLTPVANVEPLSEPPVVATAPLGAQGYDPLSHPSLGRMVSPELPPLSGADTYLPDGGRLQQSANGFIWPAKGVLTSGYGWRWGRMHRGIDIAGPIGTPIVAADSGVVTYAQWNDGGYGYLVEITHADGSQTLYAHNSRILVQKGQQVAQGEQISEMGSTGFSTGPHLHFEIHPAGQGAVNPMAFLPDDDSRASQ